MYSSLTKYSLAAAVAVMGVASTGCQQQSDPVVFQVTVPEPNVVNFQATLTRHYGIGLAGSFNLPKDVGSVVLSPESPAQGFGLGVNLNTQAFLRETWVDFKEVNALPTGAPFPGWMAGPVVDVTSPELNRGGVDYHFLLGTRSQYYVGAAGLIHAIDERFPAINIGYTFYDKQGRVVVGFQFFGPKVENGRAVVPGGIFIGTNLTPFLPKEMQPGQPRIASVSSALRVQNGEILRAVAAINRGKPATINGKSVVADIVASGPDARRYRSKRALQGVIDRFMDASRRTY